MFKQFIILTTCFVAGLQVSIAQNAYQWQLAGIDTTIHHVVDFIELPDSNLIITGTAYQIPGDTTQADPFLIRTDKKGNIIWAKTYPGTVAETITGISLLNASQLVVSATSHSFNNRIIFNEFNNYTGAIHYYFDLSGNLLEANAYQYQGLNTTGEYLNTLAGYSFLAGTIEDEKIKSYVLKTNENNSLNNVLAINNANLALTNTTTDNNNWLGCFSTDAFNSGNQTIVASVNGNNINWATGLNYNASNVPADILTLNNGYLVCANDLNTNNLYLYKLDVNGGLIWAKSYNTNGQLFTAKNLTKLSNSEFHINGVLFNGINKGASLVVDGNGNFKSLRSYNNNSQTITQSKRTMDRGILYVLSPDDEKNELGFLLKNNNNNLYMCQEDVSNIVTSADISSAVEVKDVKNTIDITPDNLTPYKYEFNTPTIFTKEIFTHQTCFKCDVDASFTYTVDPDCYIVTFTPNDSTLKELYWDFGVIEGFSEVKQPVFEYDAIADYEVTLQGFNKCGMDVKTQTVKVERKFLASADVTIDCYTISSFPVNYNASNKYVWATNGWYSDDPNLNYSYKQANNYSLLLTASNHCIAETEYWPITIDDKSLDAMFTVSNTCEDYLFTLVNNNNVNTVRWEFGDGGTDNTNTNPIQHRYNSGNYAVKAIVENECFSDTSIIDIVVDDYTVDPKFTYTNECNTISFESNSTNATIIAWDFDDGNTDSIANPQHNFGAAGGDFTVTLTLTDACGKQFSSNQTLSLLDFDVDPTFSDAVICNEFTFEANEPIGNLTDVYWDFGDGNSAIGHQVKHIFAADGSYNVTMTAFNACNVVNITRNISYTSIINQVGFNVTENCNVVTFANTSSVNALSYLWNFGNGNTSTDENPIENFNPGTYSVSLTVDFGCELLVYTEEVVVPNYAMNPDFNANIFCLETEFKIKSNTNIATTQWTLGDGSTRSNTFAFTYVYATAGSYPVKVIVTNACGDVDSLQKTINISNVVNASAGPDVTICQGQNTKLQATGGRNITWSPAGLLSDASNDNPTAFPNTTTIYTVTISDNVCTGTDLDQVTVTVVPRPTATVSGKETICEGEFAQLPVAFSGTGPFTLEYTLNGNNYFFGPTAATNTNLPVGEAGIVNIINVTDQNCKAATAGTAEVNVNLNPIANIGNSIIEVCDNDFSGISFPVDLTENGDWELTLGLNMADLPMEVIANSPYNYDVTQAGVYTINKVQNANCIGEGVGEVTVINHNSPAVNFNSFESLSLCKGSSVNWVLTFSGQAPFSFDLYRDGALINSFNNLYKYAHTLTFSQGGDYEIKNLSDKNCTNSSVFGSIIVDEYLVPDAVISGGGSLCNGDPAEVIITLTGGQDFDIIYAVNGVAKPVFTSNFADEYSLLTSEIGVYTLLSVSDNGCEGTVSGQAEVFPEPSATLSGDQDICSNEIKYLDVKFTGKPIFEILLFKDGTPYGSQGTIENDFKFPINAPGVYTISTFNDASACGGNTVGKATVNGYQTAVGTISGGGAICENGEATITINLTGTKPYTFVYSRDYAPAFMVKDYNQNTFAFTSNIEGNYRLPYLTNEKCDNTPFYNDYVNISHIPVPTATLIKSDTICEGEPHNFEVDFTGYIGHKKITYSFNGDVILEDSVITSPFIIPATERGDYKLISIQDSLCFSEQIFALGKLTVHDLPTLVLSGDTTICSYETAPVVFDFTGEAPYSADLYRNGVLSRTVKPIYTDHFALTVPEPGKYSVVDFSDANCSNANFIDTVVTIDHFISSVPRFKGGGLFCDEDSITLRQDILPVQPEGTANVIWNFDDGTTATNPDRVTHRFAEDRCYDVSLTHITDDGCIFTKTEYDFVCIDHAPTANFIYEPKEPTIFSDYINLINESTNGAEFVWTFNNGLDGTNDDFNTTYSSFNRLEGNLTNVCLQATSYLGCQNDICKEIYINDEFVHYVPNSFTPNGDGTNDYFAPVTHNADNYLFELQIFDRLGKLVYASNQVKLPIWDGRLDGSLVKQDVYTWKLRIKSNTTNQSEIEYGIVTVIY
jgi:gliding motility-associated-like protein